MAATLTFRYGQLQYATTGRGRHVAHSGVYLIPQMLGM